MAWYAVYKTATGELVSTATKVDSENIPADCTFIPIDHPPGADEMWDAATHSVVPRLPSKDQIRDSIIIDLMTVWGGANDMLTEMQRTGAAHELVDAVSAYKDKAWQAIMNAVAAWVAAPDPASGDSIDAKSQQVSGFSQIKLS